MKVFTTGQVAKICGVAPRTVCQWSDKGRLKSFRKPHSPDRCFKAQDVTEFIRQYGLQHLQRERSNDARIKVLLVIADDMYYHTLAQAFPESFRVARAHGSFEVAMDLEHYDADVVIIDTAIGFIPTQELCRNLYCHPYFLHTLIVGLYDSQKEARSRLFSEVIRKPFDPILLVERLKTLVALARKIV